MKPIPMTELNNSLKTLESLYPAETPRECDRLMDDEFIKLLEDKSILFNGLIEVRRICQTAGCMEGANKVNEVFAKYFHP